MGPSHLKIHLWNPHNMKGDSSIHSCPDTYSFLHLEKEEVWGLEDGSVGKILSLRTYLNLDPQHPRKKSPMQWTGHVSKPQCCRQTLEDHWAPTVAKTATSKFSERYTQPTHSDMNCKCFQGKMSHTAHINSQVSSFCSSSQKPKMKINR